MKAVASGIFYLLLLMGFPVLASEGVGHSDHADAHVHGSHAECALPKSAMDIVRCAREEGPSALRAKLNLNQAQAMPGMAGQFKNPELDVESVRGDIDGTKQGESKISVLIPIEIGGKRSARKQEAASEVKVADAELVDTQAEITINMILKLYRLRQLDAEKSLLEESVRTFSQIINQQKSRPGLSAEQRVSVSVFKMAMAEAKIRQSELFEEEKSIEHFVHMMTGHSLAEVRPVLPTLPKSWPAVATASENPISPRVAKSLAEMELALARSEAARADSWPELKIGPMAMLKDEGNSSGSLYGFQLSMGLPLFSLNKGAREYGRLGEDRAVKSLALTRTEENHDRSEQVRVYERAVSILKESPTAEDVEKVHAQQEADSRRGLLSPALVIEAHRQVEDLTRSRHGRELKALESLWRIYKFDGKILEASL